MKKFGFRKAALAVAGTALALTACGGGGAVQGGAKDGDQVTLQWTIWSSSQKETDAWLHLGDMVTEKYPNIKMDFSTTSFAEYFTKLQTLSAGNELPCIAAVQVQRTPAVGSLFIPLNDKVPASEVEAFEPAVISALTYKDSLRALPYDIGTYFMYYNKDAFKAAGLELPKVGWTTDDFLAAAKALTGNGKYGYATTGNPENWLSYTLGLGGDYLTKDGELDFLNDKVVEGFTWAMELSTVHGVMPPAPATNDQQWGLNQWQAGNVAMAINGPWAYMNTRAQVDFDFGIAPFPAVNGNSYALTTGSGFGVTEACSFKDEAIQAIQVLTGVEAQQYLGDIGRALPARTAQQDSWYSKADPVDAEALKSTMAGAVPYKTTPNWDAVANRLISYGVEALNGNKTPREVLELVQQETAGK